MSNEIKPYKNKGTCVELETDDMTAILETIIDTSIARMGRPANFPPTKQGLDDFINKTLDFFEHVKTINADPEREKKLIPDIEAWAQFIGVTRQTIWSYEQRGGEWQDCIQYYKNAIAAVKKQLALTYRIPPMVAVFDLANNHNYHNTNEFRLKNDIEQEKPQKEINIDERARISGLIWDETAGEYVVDE